MLGQQHLFLHGLPVIKIGIPTAHVFLYLRETDGRRTDHSFLLYRDSSSLVLYGAGAGAVALIIQADMQISEV